MAEKNKKLTEKEMDNKLRDLKIELLKNTTKRKGIKKEIARLLTAANTPENAQTKLEDKNK